MNAYTNRRDAVLVTSLIVALIKQTPGQHAPLRTADALIRKRSGKDSQHVLAYDEAYLML